MLLLMVAALTQFMLVLQVFHKQAFVEDHLGHVICSLVKEVIIKEQVEAEIIQMVDMV
jgi:hypothetical protein